MMRPLRSFFSPPLRDDFTASWSAESGPTFASFHDVPTTFPNPEPDGDHMATIWKGSLTFGLVNIPVELRSAVKSDHISLRLLHEEDLSPVKYERV
jgi:hypothetical protein